MTTPSNRPRSLGKRRDRFLQRQTTHTPGRAPFGAIASWSESRQIRPAPIGPERRRLWSQRSWAGGRAGAHPHPKRPRPACPPSSRAPARRACRPSPYCLPHHLVSPVPSPTSGGRARLEVTSAGLAAATVGQPSQAQLAAAGGQPPYLWSVGGLPAGLSVERHERSGHPVRL